MTWTKLSDDFSDDCWQLSDAAYRLHTEGLIWSNRKLLNLRLDKAEMRLWAKHPRRRRRTRGMRVVARRRRRLRDHPPRRLSAAPITGAAAAGGQPGERSEGRSSCWTATGTGTSETPSGENPAGF